MANIKFINGNPIVASSVDLADGSLDGVVMIDGSIDGSKIADGSIPDSKLSDSGVTRAVDETADMLESYIDDGLTSLNPSAWVNGGVQTNRKSPVYGQVVYSTHTICTQDRLHASDDVQVFCESGYIIGFIPYSSDDDSSIIYASDGYAYEELMWKRVLLVPSGIYYRVIMRTDPHSDSDVLDPSEVSRHVHFVTSGYRSFEQAETGFTDLRPKMKWKLGQMTNGVPDWKKNTHLLSPETIHAEKSVRVRSDDSIVRPYVYLYAADGTFLRAVRCSVIPKGAYYRLDLNVRDGSSQAHYGMTEAIELVEMDENFIWYGTSGTTAVAYADTRIIQCSPERHDYPVVVSLRDYSKYLVGVYLKADGNVVSTFDYESLYSGPVGVPAGQWHHIYMGKVGDAAFTEDDIAEAVSLLEVTPIHGCGPSIDGVRNELSVLKIRVSELEGESVPDYYESQTYSLNDRIADVLAANERPKESVVQFAFVTDFHANVYSQSFKTRALLNKVFEETNCSTFVNGGDNMNGKLTSDNTPVSHVAFAKGMQKWTNWLVPDGCGLALTVAGNHDGGVDYNPNTTARIDEQTLYEMSTLGLTAGNVTLDANSKCSYYVDDGYHKIRWIVGNVGNTNNIGKWSSATYGVTGESKADAVSFVGQALGSMAGGWTAIVINHILINSWSSGPAKGAQALEDVCDMFKARSNGTIEGRYYDFSSASGEIAFILGGHLHIDYDYETTGGIKCIITTTDNRGGQCRIDEQRNKLVMDATIRPDGTTSEQAFDIFTVDTANRTISTVRIGFGVDRSWSY